MMTTVAFRQEGELALLTIDNPPVNLLARRVCRDLAEALASAMGEPGVRAIVITGAGRAFVAGADITEFSADSAAPGVGIDEVLARVEASTKPVVAAINGMAFGGGLELALCCDYRVASSQAVVGLPEVELGLLPGGGGTQRLPRLIGIAPALELISSGEPVPATRAAALGIVDVELGPDHLAESGASFVEGALAYARELVAHDAPLRKLRDEQVPLGSSAEAKELFAAARRRLEASEPRRFAHEMIVCSVEAALASEDFEAGMATEKRCFERCVAHPQHDALAHLFFAERACAKVPGLDPGARARAIRRVVVVGGAQLERFAKLLSRARPQLEVARVEASELEAPDRRATLAETQHVLVSPSVAILDRLGPQLGTDTILGIVEPSGNSAEEGQLDALAARGGRPARTLGLRLAPNARLLEIVRGRDTDDETVATMMKLGKATRTTTLCTRTSTMIVGADARAAFEAEVQALLDEGIEPLRLSAVLGAAGLRVELGSASIEARGGSTIDDEDILDRCLRAWAKASQRLLDEGVVERAGDVDIACVRGHGFPALLGGPLHWLATVGRSR